MAQLQTMDNREVPWKENVSGKFQHNPYYDQHHDPYFLKKKIADPSICRQCGAVFHKGSFRWISSPPQKASLVTCPACLRIREKYVGGTILIEGKFALQHQEEILHLSQNIAQKEQKRRPLQRIIEIETNKNAMRITTTYEHIARRIGEAIHNAYQGELKLSYPQDEKAILVLWKRNIMTANNAKELARSAKRQSNS